MSSINLMFKKRDFNINVSGVITLTGDAPPWPQAIENL